MVSTSNDGIMTEYLVKYGVIKTGERSRPTDLLETLYMADHYRAGRDLKKARESYDISIWSGVAAQEVEKRLTDLDTFMIELSRDRTAMWGLN